VNTSVLQAHDISHSYDTFQVLAPTDLHLQSGEITILAGPNGAGKSTLLHCLSGVLRPTTGDVIVAGYNVYSQEQYAKRCLAFVADVPRFYTELTAWEHLRFMALAHNAMDDFEVCAEELMREFNFWEARDLFPHNYSRGMRLKLGLSLALIRSFKVLLLDEPTSALDAESIGFLVNHLCELRDQGAGILFSTHVSDIGKGFADNYWDINNGILGME
jgi:ABC-2 type transport system ATP-binding protein